MTYPASRPIRNIVVTIMRRPRRYLRYLALCQVIIASIVVTGMMTGCGGVKDTPVPTPDEGIAGVVSFTTEDDITLRGRLFGQSEIGIVLAHMFPADQSSWWGFAQVLEQEGYMALSFNFRGYGQGESKSEGGKEIGIIDRDVQAAMRFLGEQGASTIFLAGASMGGTAALKVAADAPVAGVIGLSPPVEFRGLTLEDVRIETPVLLMAAAGDGSAVNSINKMIDEGIVGGPGLTKRVIYETGQDHGTNILEGEHGENAREQALRFLEAHSP